MTEDGIKPPRRIRKTYVDVPDGQMHCYAVDGAQPAILFLHQTASSAASYRPLLAALDRICSPTGTMPACTIPIAKSNCCTAK